MTIDMSQFYEVFFDESDELLGEAERLLLDLNIENPDSEHLNAIFRAAHSIKGGAATFGFMDMTDITHVLENLLDRIRKNEMRLTAEHVDAFLTAKDVLKMQLDGHRSASEVDLDQITDVKMMLKSLSDNGDVLAPSPVTKSAQAVAIEQATATATHTPLADGLHRFNISFKKVTEKDLGNLKDEIELLGSVSRGDDSAGKPYLLLDTESNEDEILSICSFVLEPEDLIIIRVNLSEKVAEVAVVPAEVAKAVAVASTAKTNKVQVEEEVGYGLFEMDGGESVEEGYGFFAPFKPHPNAAALQLIGDDTPPPAVVTEAVAVVATAEKINLGRRDSDRPPLASETTSIRVGIEKVDQLINLVGGFAS